jgi:DNA repair protein RadC
MKIPEITISIKYKRGKNAEEITFQRSEDTAQVMRKLFDAGQIEWTEEFIMLCLNNANKVIGYYRVSKGGMMATVADTRVIATVALQTLAVRVIIAHNHPSGSLRPSEADKNATNKIKGALNLLEIDLLDHLIITKNGYYSFSDEGFL